MPFQYNPIVHNFYFVLGSDNDLQILNLLDI